MIILTTGEYDRANKILLASKILRDFGLELSQEWNGKKNIWHVWHSPYLVYRLTFYQYVERIIEIYMFKPPGEHEQRLRCMKPVLHEFTLDAYAEWECADNECSFNSPRWSRAYAVFEHAEALTQIHAQECPWCGWDGKQMTFQKYSIGEI